jgi:hypothetical protein
MVAPNMCGIEAPLQGLICILSPFPSVTLRLHWAIVGVAPLVRNSQADSEYFKLSSWTIFQ